MPERCIRHHHLKARLPATCKSIDSIRTLNPFSGKKSIPYPAHVTCITCVSLQAYVHHQLRHEESTGTVTYRRRHKFWGTGWMTWQIPHATNEARAHPLSQSQKGAKMDLGLS